MITFGSKAETLERLEKVVKKAKILPQIRLDAMRWDKSFLVDQLERKGWKNLPLIVRSSASREDSIKSSFAGHFASVSHVFTLDELCKSIDSVISSYGKISDKDQVFIQPMLQSISMSGVIFSYDQRTGAPYRVVNYDDITGSTNTVTSGSSNALKVYYAHRSMRKNHPKRIDLVISMMEELEFIFNHSSLDAEFAITRDEQLFLFQVRHLTVKNRIGSVQQHTHLIKNIASTIQELNKPHPYLQGSKTIFGIMPDWNPAEIIGTRPRPLALSIYKELVTDSIWACQRAKYGYRNLKNHSLLFHFQGLPYVDVRASFNSFIPADLDDQLAEKLVNHYLDKLERLPHLHDKIEFEIAYSCYTLDLPERLVELKNAGFTPLEINRLVESLRILTNRIITPKNGLCSHDLLIIKNFESRFEQIQNSSLNIFSKIYWHLENCRDYGTLPFAGIARAGFIAIQFLKSLVYLEILSPEEMDLFFSSLSTVCKEIQFDRNVLSKNEFLQRYGHLREGTYDILSPRYDEMFPYENWNLKPEYFKIHHTFNLNSQQKKRLIKALNEHHIDLSEITLFEFIKSAVEGREYSKFVFTKGISEILRLIKQVGNELGLTLEECSYLDVQDIKKLYSCSLDPRTLLLESISRGKKEHSKSQHILLPPLIMDSSDVWSFNISQSNPNYITLKKAAGDVFLMTSKAHPRQAVRKMNISGKIVMISSADPGYDWIFTYPIAGLITMYGGANSHMAIRSAEMGIPAVIGAGEILYQQWSQARLLEIDCENKTVRAFK